MPRRPDAGGALPGLRVPALAVECLAVFVLAALFHTLIEIQWSGLADTDPWYHTKIAWLYWTGECPIFGGDFPWTRFSRYNEIRHDWHLGYHLLLIPFVWFGLVPGGKAAVVASCASLTTVIYWVVRRNGLPAALAGALVVAFTLGSAYHTFRIHLLRPTSVLLAVLIALIHLCGRQRAVASFVCASLLLLLYNVPHSIVLLAGVTGLVVALRERRIAWGTTGALLGAVALTTLIHPGFWHWEGSFFGLEHGNFSVWRQMAGTLEASRNDFRVLYENEWIPMPVANEFKVPRTYTLHQRYLFPFAFLLATSLLCAYRRRLGNTSAVFALMAFAYLVLFLESIRFLEYWIPLSFVASGCLLADALRDAPAAPWERGPRLGRPALLGVVGAAGLAQLASLLLADDASRPVVFLPTLLAGVVVLARPLVGVFLHVAEAPSLAPRRRAALLAGMLLVTLAWGRYAVHQLEFFQVEGPAAARDVRRDGLPEIALWLNENANPGDLVYHDTWPAFPFLFHYDHRNHYLVGFDPYFFYQYDPRLFRAWVLSTRGQWPAKLIREHLLETGARYVVATKLRPTFLREVGKIPEATPVFRNDFGTVFRMDRVPAPRS